MRNLPSWVRNKKALKIDKIKYGTIVSLNDQ